MLGKTAGLQLYRCVHQCSQVYFMFLPESQKLLALVTSFIAVSKLTQTRECLDEKEIYFVPLIYSLH